MSSCVLFGLGTAVDFWAWRIASSATFEPTTCYASPQFQASTSATFCLRFNNISNSDERSSFYKSRYSQIRTKTGFSFTTSTFWGLRCYQLKTTPKSHLHIQIWYPTIHRSEILSLLFVHTINDTSPYSLHSLHKSLWNITFLKVNLLNSSLTLPV